MTGNNYRAKSIHLDSFFRVQNVLLCHNPNRIHFSVITVYSETRIRYLCGFFPKPFPFNCFLFLCYNLFIYFKMHVLAVWTDSSGIYYI